MFLTRVSVLVASLALTASVAVAQPQTPPAGGQRAGGPPAPSNLQVMPKDITREQLIQCMQNIAAGLGVQCNSCHVQEGRGGRNDMASDEKQTKKTARQMMIFVRDLNEKLPAVVSKSANDTTRVGCVTCHRGVPVPMTLQAVLAKLVTEKGMDGAIAEYRTLRTKYTGTMAYDLTENGLIAMSSAALG